MIPKVTVPEGSRGHWKPPAGVRYGVVWHDIWSDICTDNLDEMIFLKRRYGRRADWQGCWSEYETRRELNRKRNRCYR